MPTATSWESRRPSLRAGAPSPLPPCSRIKTAHFGRTFRASKIRRVRVNSTPVLYTVREIITAEAGGYCQVCSRLRPPHTREIQRRPSADEEQSWPPGEARYKPTFLQRQNLWRCKATA